MSVSWRLKGLFIAWRASNRRLVQPGMDMAFWLHYSPFPGGRGPYTHAGKTREGGEDVHAFRQVGLSGPPADAATSSYRYLHSTITEITTPAKTENDS